jgi:hypothetical protein
MKKITINESQEELILNAILKEEIEGAGWGDKVLTVKKYLDANFVRADSTIMGKDGQPTQQQVVAWTDKNGKILRTLSDVQLFYMVQEKFKNILPDKKERDNFLKQVLKDWYSKSISKAGSLKKY